MTKGIFAHLQRKLQILHYYTLKKIENSYSLCLVDLKFVEDEDRKRLTWLSEMYFGREALTQEAARMYFDIAEKLTKEINFLLKR